MALAGTVLLLAVVTAGCGSRVVGVDDTRATQAVPLATPDLTAVQQLLVDLDAALGADATADTDEGSAP